MITQKKTYASKASLVLAFNASVRGQSFVPVDRRQQEDACQRIARLSEKAEGAVRERHARAPMETEEQARVTAAGPADMLATAFPV